MYYIIQALTYPLPFLLVLTVLVFVHEFGHFWVARRCGVKIDTFSIGFGKELFGWNDRRGTRWKFSILPLGGFVKMYGDEDGTSWNESPDTSAMTEADRKQVFANKPVIQRAAVILAGPAFNFIFSIIVFAVLFATFGERFITPTVQEVLPGSSAESAGVRPGDEFLTIDGHQIKTFEDIAELVQLHPNMPLVATVRNAGVERTLTITPRVNEEATATGRKTRDVRIGIKHTDDPQLIKLNILQSVERACIDTYKLVRDTLLAVWQMINGTRPSDELGGVIAIGQMSHDTAKSGAVALIYFMAALSVNLGLLNLFPIPILDGGHLVFCAIEAVKGSPPGEQVMKYSFRFGLALVLMLAVFANWNDLVHLGLLDIVHDRPS